jgi:hypothetical protein
MTSRERVVRALEFRSPDRAPRNLWTLPWVGMFAPRELADLLAQCPDDFAGPAAVLAPGDRERGEPCRKGTYVDGWGCVWDCGEDGVIGEVKSPLLADWTALDAYAPPWEIIDRADWDAADRAQEANISDPGAEKFMWSFTEARPFERMQFLRGTENLMLDIGYGTSEMLSLRDMVHEFNLKLVEKWAGTSVDGLGIMDDWGSQTSLLISPATWRELFKPLYKDYSDLIRSAGKKVFFHSDGNIIEILGDLVEIGVGAVNSQLFCMDIDEIARRHKGRITFWGEIDRQHVLPHGTIEDVRRAVGRVRRALDDGAGGVIAQCEWGVRNPAENIRAVFDAWDEAIEYLPRA